MAKNFSALILGGIALWFIGGAVTVLGYMDYLSTIAVTENLSTMPLGGGIALVGLVLVLVGLGRLLGRLERTLNP